MVCLFGLHNKQAFKMRHVWKILSSSFICLVVALPFAIVVQSLPPNGIVQSNYDINSLSFDIGQRDPPKSSYAKPPPPSGASEPHQVSIQIRKRSAPAIQSPTKPVIKTNAKKPAVAPLQQQYNYQKLNAEDVLAEEWFHPAPIKAHAPEIQQKHLKIDEKKLNVPKAGQKPVRTAAKQPLKNALPLFDDDDDDNAASSDVASSSMNVGDDAAAEDLSEDILKRDAAVRRRKRSVAADVSDAEPAVAEAAKPGEVGFDADIDVYKDRDDDADMYQYVDIEPDTPAAGPAKPAAARLQDLKRRRRDAAESEPQPRSHRRRRANRRLLQSPQPQFKINSLHAKSKPVLTKPLVDFSVSQQSSRHSSQQNKLSREEELAVAHDVPPRAAIHGPIPAGLPAPPAPAAARPAPAPPAAAAPPPPPPPDPPEPESQQTAPAPPAPPGGGDDTPPPSDAAGAPTTANDPILHRAKIASLKTIKKRICKKVRELYANMGFTGNARTRGECTVTCERRVNGRKSFQVFKLVNWPCGDGMRGYCQQDASCKL